ncbi:ArsA-related P-loop ATPase [Naumannella halotolerans]|uniref:ArsA-related P-loop ATPase n=1 Tax=Naumannella halotolerans TaxID=993414 RepID=UPI001FB95AD0|nr:ArsA-related P-loop ATPase [Naumannella halotolerans]
MSDRSLLAPQLHVISGKGGTGKTTIAASLACALAAGGHRVLVCEVEGRQGLAEVFGTDPLPSDSEPRLARLSDGGQIHGLHVDAEQALAEYLAMFYKLGVAAKAMDRFGLFDFATSIAPGLRDVLLSGKVYEAVRRRAKNSPDSYDAVVLDAPPTGRIGTFLNVHAAISGLAKVGPIRSQADSILQLFRSRATVVHLVTLLEDMPVTETLDAITDLAPTRIRVGSLIANRIRETPMADADLQAAARGALPMQVPALDADRNTALREEFASDARVILDERAHHARLAELGLPLVSVPVVPGGIDRGALLAIADRLRAELGRHPEVVR